jgi:hypothetical protein
LRGEYTMTDNDRWFRKVIDADSYLHFERCEHSHYFIDGKSGNTYVEPTVDEMIAMYSWKFTSDNIFEYVKMRMYFDGYMITNMNDGKYFTGQSWCDCWLQLVMWDKFGMTWNDDESRWLK